MRATWKGALLAESDATVLVEGNHYFPPESLHREFLSESRKCIHCPWKGEAHYYHVTVEGERNEDAAWTYTETKDAAAHIEGYVAFWRGVEVTE